MQSSAPPITLQCRTIIQSPTVALQLKDRPESRQTGGTLRGFAAANDQVCPIVVHASNLSRAPSARQVFVRTSLLSRLAHRD